MEIETEIQEEVDPSITIKFTNIYAKLIMKCYQFTDTYLQITRIMNILAFKPKILQSLWRFFLTYSSICNIKNFNLLRT